MFRLRSLVACFLLSSVLAGTSAGQGVSILESAPPKPATALQDALGLPTNDGLSKVDTPEVATQSEELPLPAPVESSIDQSGQVQQEAGRPAISPQSIAPGQAGLPSIPPRQPPESQFVVGAPVHEAFATVAQPIVRAGPIVPYVPPSAVSEQPSPPSRRGTNAAWIKGYWAFHEDTFIWVTGLNREIPPGRRWVSGQWAKAAGGFQWYSGFWADGKSAAVDSVPRPPEFSWSLPNPSVQEGSFWIPDSLRWNDNQFALIKGYSTQHQPKFIWQPDTYVQTPQGFIFVSGYWDFDLTLRGTPMAATAIASSQLGQSLRFTPNVFLASDATLLTHLFVRRNDHRLYFASFADSSGLNQGMVPWYSKDAETISASPFRSYYAWKYGQLGVSLDSATNNIVQLYRSRPDLDVQLGVTSQGGQQVSAIDSVSGRYSSFDSLLRGRTTTNQTAQAPRTVQPSPVPESRSSLGAQTRPQPRTSARIVVSPFGITPPVAVVPGITRPPVVRPRIGPPTVLPVPTPGFRGRALVVPPFGISPPVGIPRPPVPSFRRFRR